MDIAKLIQEARSRAGLSQQALAELAETSQPAIAKIESGRGQPSLETTRRLVAAAGFELRIELIPRSTNDDPVVGAYKAGVDRTLIRDNLRKTVDRRLRDMEAFRKSAAELRSAVRRAPRRG